MQVSLAEGLEHARGDVESTKVGASAAITAHSGPKHLPPTMRLVAGQATWYRMENGPKTENGKQMAKRRPVAQKNGGKMAQRLKKIIGVWGLFFFSSAIFRPRFPTISGHGAFPILRPIFLPFSAFGTSIQCQAA